MTVFLCDAAAGLGACTDAAVGSGSSTFNKSIQDVFIAPQSFDDLQVGEPVSLPRIVFISTYCETSGTNTYFGFGSLPVPGAYAVSGQTNMFTTPQLEAVGLGYKAWWDPYAGFGCSCYHRRMELTSVDVAVPPDSALVNSYFRAATPDYVPIQAKLAVQFYKIGPIQNTDGVTVPASITTNLVNLYVTERYNTNYVATSYLLTWTTNTFVSKVRACTPIVDQTIHFGNITFNATPTPGQVIRSRYFALSFTCPYMAYTQIGYSFKPKYGTITPTIMALKPGGSSATGLGIRLCYGAPCAQFQEPPVTFDETYYLADFDMFGWFGTYHPNLGGGPVMDAGWLAHADPSPPPDGPRGGALVEERTKNIGFYAELVRTTEPFTPGTINSTVWIYIKYK